MELDSLATGPINSGFLVTWITIILIDIVLSGDNAVVMAMAVHALEAKTRLKGIIIGVFGAVTLRVGLTWFASQLLQTPFLKMGGGLIILWLAVKLLVEQVVEPGQTKRADSFWHAILIILVADVTMSFDNVLAVAGAAKGSALKIWLSLGLTIPLVIFASTMISRFMDKHPFILYIGAALLGKVGGEMIMTDPVPMEWYKLDSLILKYSVEAVCIIGVLLVARWLKRRLANRERMSQS